MIPSSLQAQRSSSPKTQLPQLMNVVPHVRRQPQVEKLPIGSHDLHTCIPSLVECIPLRSILLPCQRVTLIENYSNFLLCHILIAPCRLLYNGTDHVIISPTHKLQLTIEENLQTTVWSAH